MNLLAVARDPRRLLPFAIFLAVFGLYAIVIVSAAFADPAVAAAPLPPTAIALGPILDALQPLITALVSGVIMAFVTIATYWVNSLLKSWSATAGLSIDAAHRDALTKACTTEAGAILAKLNGNLATAQFDVGNPLVAQAAQAVIARMPDAIAHFNASDAQVAKIVLGQIGILQATAFGGAAPAVKP